jgi:2-methylcitrate dehydratase PrpD
MTFATPTAFIHELRWEDLPAHVRAQARRCLLDTLGTAIGGRRTDLSRIVHAYAAEVYQGRDAQLWLDGRTVSPPGAALANGMMIDALDIHDGERLVKGHASVAVVPSALATLGLGGGGAVTGRELLTTLVVGWEVALRAGRALHATACDYHTSGAWSALGCAAVTARRLGLGTEATRHALGIAEYHGPRSQMMRCIDHPTMLKDGSGWGAMTGVSAALLARGGFTGAPAVTVEGDELADIWSDVGHTWLTAQQDFKPYAVCYWAQPAIAGALALQRAHHVPLETIRRIQVFTFREASRLAVSAPRTTEEAQYSLPFPVAAALVHGQLGVDELTGEGLRDPLVLRLAGRLELIEDADYARRFPEERIARVRIETEAGETFDSGEALALWDGQGLPSDATLPSDAELRAKYRWLARSGLPAERAAALEAAAWDCADLPAAATLLSLLAPPATADR